MSGTEREPGPWQALRDVAIPPGMRGRVRDGVEGALDRAAFARRRPVRARRWVLGAAAAASAMAAAIVAAMLVRTPDNLAATIAPPAPTAPIAAAGVPPRTVAVAAGERVVLSLARGHVSMRGPADAVMDGAAVTLLRGTLDVLGQVEVRGPTCSAQIDGTAAVSVIGATLVVRRFAGSVQLSQAAVDCQVLEVDGPSAPAPPPPPRVAPPRPPAPIADHRTAPAAPDPLAAAVAAYRDAAALEALDPATALEAWRAWLVRWPDSALAHSVELRMLGVLGRLGRHAEATARARAFLRRYPDSPRRADVERLLGAAP